MKLNNLMFIIHLALRGAHDLIDDIGNFHGLEIQAQAIGFDLGIIVQVRDQGGHALHVGTDRAQEVGLHLVDLAHRSGCQ